MKSLPLTALSTLIVLLASCDRSPSDAEHGARTTIAPDPTPADDPLTVHEWGTFTTLQGATGGSLDGLQHETESLPHFVHSRTAAQPSPFAVYGDTSLDVPIKHVGGKMETPVIYFYTKGRRHVRVHVDFENGLLTQWYPNASIAAPSLGAKEASFSDIAALTRSSLEWELDLTPAAAEPPSEMPSVEQEDPWQFARETNADWVRNGSGEAERYVFYRGLGRMQLPMGVMALGSSMTVVHNKGAEPMTAAFVLEMQASGVGRFKKLEALGAGQALSVSLGEIALRDKEQVVADLQGAVSAALVAQGLYADEARAMVRTWSRTWFASEGTRVIYMVPTKATEAILPMTIEPKPASLVRVLVGRHEYLTPDAEREVAALLAKRMSADVSVREAAMKRLAHLGRFLEPTVRRVIDGGDPVVVKSGKEILASFHAR